MERFFALVSLCINDVRLINKLQNQLMSLICCHDMRRFFHGYRGNFICYYIQYCSTIDSMAVPFAQLLLLLWINGIMQEQDQLYCSSMHTRTWMYAHTYVPTYYMHVCLRRTVYMCHRSILFPYHVPHFMCNTKQFRLSSRLATILSIDQGLCMHT